MKSAAERSIEALTWASVVIWLGFALVAHILNYVWLVVMVLGIILLSSAIYQRSRGWQTSLSIWIFGIWMAVFSVIETVSAMLGSLDSGGLTIDLWVYLGIALVSMGVAVVLRSVQGPSLASAKPRAAQSDEITGYGRAPVRATTPRRVDEDYSAGYIPPPGSESQYYDESSQYGGQRAQRYDDSTQYSRRADAYNQPARGDSYEYAPQQGYDYDQQPQQDYYYEQPGQPQPQDDYAPDWDQPAPSRRAPAPGDRRRSARGRSERGRRTARRADEPSDLESRVEDIIRRSRERRDQVTDDDLPY